MKFVNFLLGMLINIFLATQAFAGGAIQSNDMGSIYADEVEIGQNASFSVNGISLTNSALVFGGDTNSETFKLIKDSRFSIEATLQSIINSSPNPDILKRTLINSIFETLTDPVRFNNGVFMPVDVRSLESSLAKLPGLLSLIKPIGLFNRIDLAAEDGRHCGESRIVYAMPNFARFFIIFEAQQPNPQPELGLKGCHVIGDFWADLPVEADARLTKLAEFYFGNTSGMVSHNGTSFPAAINFDNFTVNAGQIRTNQFVDTINSKWQLREFKVTHEGDEIKFKSVTVKDNPLAEMYGPLGDLITVDQQGLAEKFQIVFLQDYLPQLTSIPISSSLSEFNIVNSISVSIDDRFNEFQSDSEGFLRSSSSDEPRALVSAELAEQINDKLDEEGDLAVDIVLNRVGSQTCGGCHQFSNDQVIGIDSDTGESVLWPRSAKFVHMNESGFMSPALREFFLPHRLSALANFLAANNEPDALQAVFTANCILLVCHFDASASINGVEATDHIANYQWQFGNGLTINQTTDSTTHEFNFPGHYDVTLTVTDENGVTDSQTQTIIIQSNLTASLVRSGVFFNFVKLDWLDIPGNLVDIYVDGEIHSKRLNRGSIRIALSDSTNRENYKVCAAGSLENCTVMVTTNLAD